VASVDTDLLLTDDLTPQTFTVEADIVGGDVPDSLLKLTLTVEGSISRVSPDDAGDFSVQDAVDLMNAIKAAVTPSLPIHATYDIFDGSWFWLEDSRVYREVTQSH